MPVRARPPPPPRRETPMKTPTTTAFLTLTVVVRAASAVAARARSTGRVTARSLPRRVLSFALAVLAIALAAGTIAARVTGRALGASASSEQLRSTQGARMTVSIEQTDSGPVAVAHVTGLNPTYADPEFGPSTWGAQVRVTRTTPTSATARILIDGDAFGTQSGGDNYISCGGHKVPYTLLALTKSTSNQLIHDPPDQKTLRCVSNFTVDQWARTNPNAHPYIELHQRIAFRAPVINLADGVRKLLHTPQDHAGTLPALGSRVFFVLQTTRVVPSAGGGSDEYFDENLFLATPDGSRLAKIAFPAGSDFWRGAALSPDQQVVLGDGRSPGAQCEFSLGTPTPGPCPDVWTYDITRNVTVDLTNSAATIDHGASWSHDGQRVLFVRDDSSLCIVGSVGEDPHCIAQLPKGLAILNVFNNVSPAMRPLFSPDDSKILFIAAPESTGSSFGSDDLPQHAYVVNADGSALRKLASASVDQATWMSPTSVALYLHSGRLLQLNITNGHPSQLGRSATEQELLWDTISGQHVGRDSCFDYNNGIVCRDLHSQRLQRVRLG
jgi:hypothetical protein